MNKWTKTHVVVSGLDRNQLDNLYNVIKKLSVSYPQKSPKSFKYEDLLKELGVNANKVLCSGYAEKVTQRQDGIIEWEEYRQGLDQKDVYKELASYFKGVKITYCGLDSENIPFITNDVEGLFFPHRFVVIEVLDDEKEITLINTFDELSDYISEHYGTTISSPADIPSFNQSSPHTRVSEIVLMKTQYYQPK